MIGASKAALTNGLTAVSVADVFKYTELFIFGVVRFDTRELLGHRAPQEESTAG